MSGNPFWQQWYFHLPNYALALLAYTLIGRFLLSLILRPDSRNYIRRFFVQLTEPVLRIVRLITPELVPQPLLPLIGVVWLELLRVALFIVIQPTA